MEFSAQQIADFLGGHVEGDPQITVNDFAKIEEGAPHKLSFLANPKYTAYLYTTQSSIVLINDNFELTAPVSATLVRVPDAYAAIGQLLTLVDQTKEQPKANIDATAHINADATIGSGCYIGHCAYIGKGAVIGNNTKIYPFAYIGDNAKVGDDCILYAHTTLYHECVVNDRCIIHSGAVIGADGFGFAPKGDTYEKIPQLGNVVIEADVEVGANTAIDRAVMGSTVIKQGVKLDNLIQVAHNVSIGENTVIAAQTGIAGSTHIGRNCMIAGQVGIVGHLRIGDHVKLGPQAGVSKNTKDDTTLWGTPAFDYGKYTRSHVVFQQLPDLRQTVNTLKKELETLKAQLEQSK